MNNTSEMFMRKAIDEAKKAAKKGEIPIGAVIVKDNKIISKGYNTKERKQSAICHAEINVINKASKKLGTWRLDECDMYVTLQPCEMCAGAIISARIKNLYYGARNSLINEEIYYSNSLNHKLNNVTGGILEAECENIVKEFFIKLRKREKI